MESSDTVADTCICSRLSPDAILSTHPMKSIYSLFFDYYYTSIQNMNLGQMQCSAYRLNPQSEQFNVVMIRLSRLHWQQHLITIQ
ncbi:hypothetical protein C8R32_102127 [Nitrosospira sp. Nsp5]|nr:hypothetical protein C8R32_102127 [Nitrosospira sp. Nsp5]